MSLATVEHFIKRIETDAAIGISKLEAAEKRGHLTAEEMDHLNKIEGSQLSVNLTAYVLAAEREGIKVRSRWSMRPNVLEHKGVHISNANGRSRVYVYGPIGNSFGGVSGDEIRAELAKLPRGPIELHVHSPGGSFSEGVAIYNLIRSHSGDVHGFVDSQAASAGSLILMACKTVTMAVASEMMIHFASMNVEDSMTEADLARNLKLMQDTNAKLLELYLPRWKRSEKELRAAFEAETYFTPAEAVECGLADYVSERVERAGYEVVTGSCRTPGFSIAASAGPHKRFTTRKAGLKLWQVECDLMRYECGIL